MNRLVMAILASLLAAPSAATAQQQVVPSSPVLVNATVVAINNGPGNQALPHVSKDLVAYGDFSDNRIHYYRFSTGIDAAIPAGNSISDTISSVSENRVCFTRETPSGDLQIAVFDVQTGTTAEIDPQAGALRFSCALGGDTLVYADFDTGTSTGHVFVYDLAANPATPPETLSATPNAQQNLNVSPDGNTVVWENCPTAGNCDIMKAVRSGGAWTVSTVVNSAVNEENPDTDGTWIVYDTASQNVPGTISWRPVAGGSPTQLVMPGAQRHPSISRGVIGFEATLPGATTADVYVYVIATNKLYQVTSTPIASESLNDVSVLDNGDIRVVWTADDGAGGTENIYGITFTPDGTPYVQVASGFAHSCGLRGSGALECWGNDTFGQAPSARLATMGSFTAVSAGTVHTCALTDGGGAECWGNNASGEAPPKRAAQIGVFAEVSAGGSHTCALRTDGVVECWGSNAVGQAPPTRSAKTGAFVHVAAGGAHTCAVRADGVVECWGNNASQQAPPTRTAGAGTFVDVTAGALHTCATRLGGVATEAVECWGNNLAGQAPPLRRGLFDEVSAGAAHTCGITISNVKQRVTPPALVCWGNNTFGQAPPTRTPTASGGISFLSVSAGAFHTCAINQGAFVECWGNNAFGQAPAIRH
jgi:alpha-tubulin suppressor-like RCC1 family protein